MLGQSEAVCLLYKKGARVKIPLFEYPDNLPTLSKEQKAIKQELQSPYRKATKIIRQIVQARFIETAIGKSGIFKNNAAPVRLISQYAADGGPTAEIPKSGGYSGQSHQT